MTQPAIRIEDLGISRTVEADYEVVLQRIPTALKDEGFGVLTEIDVQQTLKQKIGADFRRYKILGACNPTAAHKVLQHDPQIGLLLPCNVIVYELEGGRTMVSAFDPLQIVGSAGAGPLGEVAADVRERLARAVSSIG